MTIQTEAKRVITDGKVHKTSRTEHHSKNPPRWTTSVAYGEIGDFDRPIFRPPIVAEKRLAESMVGVIRHAAPFLLGDSIITDVKHIPKIFDSKWAEALPLPIGLYKPADMEVAIWDETLDMHKTKDPHVLFDPAMLSKTKVYENVDMWGGFLGAVAQRLGEYVPGRQIICSLYESYAGAESVGMHTDGQPGIAIQLQGEKEWELADGQKFITRPGDAIFIPEGTPHKASTPRQSIHLLISAVEPSTVITEEN